MELARLQLRVQRGLEEAQREFEQLHLAADQVEALGIPEWSESASKVKVNAMQGLEKLRAPDIPSALQEASIALDEWSAEEATIESPRRLEVAKGLVQQQVILAEEWERKAAALCAAHQKVTAELRGMIAEYLERDDYSGSAEADASTQSAETDDLAE